MIDKSKYICATPFGYTEVFDDEQFLCCRGWLDTNIYETNNIKDNFNSPKAQEIRKSILDGSYKFCSETQCPHLSGFKQNKFIDKRFIPKNKESLEIYKPISKINMVNFCFDKSCNLQCPSCRNELINYLGKDRDKVDDKLKQLNDELSDTIKRMYITGTSDPFYSKSFRQFLIDFQPEKYPKLEKIWLHTNAILWTEKLWNRMSKIHKYVTECEVSIDAATKDTYENKVRLGGDWNTLIDNLKFIIKIPNIKNYTFSFVVQDTNFQEIKPFYDIITDICKNTNKKINIFYNHITNWGTFTDEVYLLKDVSNKNNPHHLSFINELKKVTTKKEVTHNFHHLLDEVKQTLI